MSTPSRTLADAAFTSWVQTLSGEDAPPRLLLHAAGCTGRARACLRVTPHFPLLLVTAGCSGARCLVAGAMWWPGALRGRTPQLRRALAGAFALLSALGLQYRIDTGYPVSIRELTEERMVRLPRDPATAMSRADVRLLLQRTVGAIGLFLTRPTGASDLAWTSAGLVALAGLEALAVRIHWPAVGWDAAWSPIVTGAEAHEAQERIGAAVETITREARNARARRQRPGAGIVPEDACCSEWWRE